MDTKKTHSVITVAANVGVVIGLILLVFELNQNRKNAHIDSYQNLMSQVNRINELRATNPVLAELIQQGNTEQELTELELTQYRSYWRMNINSGQLAHKQYARGLINEKEMQSVMGPVKTFLAHQRGQTLWENESEYYSAPFRRYVSAMMTELFPDNEYWKPDKNQT